MAHDVDDLRRRAIELVEASEQALVVYTREPESLAQLRRWAAAHPEAAQDIEEWNLGRSTFLVLVVPKTGTPRLSAAGSLEELTVRTLPGLGTPANALRKSLCKVQSADAQLIRAIAETWNQLEGLSLGRMVAQCR